MCRFRWGGGFVGDGQRGRWTGPRFADKERSWGRTAAAGSGNLPKTTTFFMTSNSIRVGAEIFNAAREAGALMSRSCAQQIEHWARIGAALEACGLTVGQVTLLLKGDAEEQTDQGDASLWAFKRQQQQADLENARSGRVTQDQLSWFSGGKARNLKLVNSPY